MVKLCLQTSTEIRYLDFLPKYPCPILYRIFVVLTTNFFSQTFDVFKLLRLTRSDFDASVDILQSVSCSATLEGFAVLPYGAGGVFGEPLRLSCFKCPKGDTL